MCCQIRHSHLFIIERPVYEIDCPEFLLPVQTWCQNEPISLCVLFGSQATGKTHPHSDVDLAVWLQERSRLWHAYNDSLPFRRAAYKQLQKFIKENPYGSSS